MKYNQNDIDRFYNKIETIDDGCNKDCWKINVHNDSDGYPVFSINGHPYRSNRFMYQIHHPDENILNMFICHSCDNPWCVNPDHLWSGTAYENNRDKINKNRHPHGNNHPNTKFTDEQVKEMLEGITTKHFKSIKEIKEHFKVSKYIITKTLNGYSKIHITKNFDLEEIKKNLEYSQLGVNGSRSKFNKEEILSIREELKSGKSISFISKKYNVNKKTIYNIKLNRSYTNVY
jgi:hypothetical protein